MLHTRIERGATEAALARREQTLVLRWLDHSCNGPSVSWETASLSSVAGRVRLACGTAYVDSARWCMQWPGEPRARDVAGVVTPQRVRARMRLSV